MRIFLVRFASLAGLALVLVCGWLGAMEFVLRHHGYRWRFVVEAVLALEALLTVAVCEDLIDVPARWPLVAGAAATGLLGAWIVADDLSRPGLPAQPHFEGYLLIVGLALIAYAVLTIAAMATAAPARCPRASAPRS